MPHSCGTLLSRLCRSGLPPALESALPGWAGLKGLLYGLEGICLYLPSCSFKVQKKKSIKHTVKSTFFFVLFLLTGKDSDLCKIANSARQLPCYRSWVLHLEALW